MSRALKIPKLSNPLSRSPVVVDSQFDDVFEEMTLAEHLNELRSRIVKVCISIGLAFIVGIILATPMLRLIRDTADVPKFDMNDVTEGITDYFKTALYIAVALALPVILYQAFAFISPGLTRKEKRLIFSSLPFAVVLFFMGASFAFFVAIPKAFQFLSSFKRDLFDFSPTFGSILSFYMQVTIGLGLAFELPIFMYLLARLGMVGPNRWSKSRRYAAVFVLIAAAVITPTPDPINMLIVAIPIYIIYEVGIVFARVGSRRHASNSLKDEAVPA